MAARSAHIGAAEKRGVVGSVDLSAATPARPQPTPARQSETSIADTVGRLAARWLDWQCRMISGVVNGAVFVRKGLNTKTLDAAALWPDEKLDTTTLRQVAVKAIFSRDGASQNYGEARHQGEAAGDYVAYPLLWNERPLGAVALVLKIRSQSQRQAVLQLLQWGTVWLEETIKDAIHRRHEQAPPLTALVAIALRDAPLEVVGHELCNHLVSTLGCTSTAFGLVQGFQVRLQALSHQLDFDRRVSGMRRLEAAMEECIDETEVVVPGIKSQRSVLTRAHTELAKSDGGRAVCSVPLLAGQRPVGVLTLSRPQTNPFDEQTVTLLTKAAEFLAPIVAIKQRDAMPLWRKALYAGRRQLERLFGPDHLRLKVTAGTLALVVAVLLVVKGEHRVVARATVEGSMQQAVVAPFDGFIATAKARAGDTVSQGDVLAELDDRDLLLQRERWSSERQKHAKEYQEALATGERARLSIQRARMEQDQAQLDLVEEQLRRTQLRAPFDGVLISGDLSRALGAPVERGQLLFEVAPRNAYRVALRVDEHDVANLASGQPGTLRLVGLPDEPVAIRVSRVLPIATAENGNNTFRVETSIESADNKLRPGMEGVAKVVVGRGSLLWVWTHALFDRLRLRAWSFGF